jgi:predicted membrane metal-binding protein
MAMVAMKSGFLAGLSILLAVAGLGLLTVLNGQTFTNSLLCLGCFLASGWLCLRGFRQHPAMPRRLLWAAGLLLLAGMSSWVVFQLPAAYRFQESFNARVKDAFDAVSRKVQDPAK